MQKKYNNVSAIEFLKKLTERKLAVKNRNKQMIVDEMV